MPTLNPCQQRVSGFLVSYRPTRHIICKKSSGGRPKSPGLDTCPKASSDAARPASVPTSAGYKELKWTWNAHEISYVTAGCGRPVSLHFCPLFASPPWPSAALTLQSRPDNWYDLEQFIYTCRLSLFTVLGPATVITAK